MRTYRTLYCGRASILCYARIAFTPCYMNIMFILHCTPLLHHVLCAHIVWHCAREPIIWYASRVMLPYCFALHFSSEHPGPVSWHLASSHLLSWHQKISDLCPCLWDISKTLNSLSNWFQQKRRIHIYRWSIFPKRFLAPGIISPRGTRKYPALILVFEISPKIYWSVNLNPVKTRSNFP